MKRALTFVLIVALFAGINFGLYMTMTRRLRQNFSGASQLRMVDVRRFLPHEEDSDLARIDSSLHFGEGDDLPVLDGAAALVPVYASVIDNCYPEGCVTYEGGVFDDDNKYGENFAPDSAMQYQNTIRGFTAVVDGSTDLFFTAHPNAEQMQYAEEQGVELEIVPIGMEAFVFFVNADNPVEDLTTDQIRAIYRNEITNWNEVGGPNRMINPVTRISGSGSQSMMDRFIEDNMLTRRHPLSIFGGSIGYSYRYYLTGLVGNDGVKMLSVNGIYPDAENIRNGTYPLTANFYAVYRRDNDNPNVRRIVDWLLSEEGQSMIEQTGYVGLI
ncbi:MAG: substrate-binding domain-containing protein [Saccharofermentans sp.]|nr:substrate-binding domain-containing protein [Saccharofermentans sp.]